LNISVLLTIKYLSFLLALQQDSNPIRIYRLIYIIVLFNKQLKEKQSGTTQSQITANVLRGIEINIPPTLSEQELIVSEIESRLSVCDKIEESITTSLLQAEALRQSILKKAFEDKLVPQDANDEPASVLLERIGNRRDRSRPVPT